MRAPVRPIDCTNCCAAGCSKKASTLSAAAPMDISPATNRVRPPKSMNWEKSMRVPMINDKRTNDQFAGPIGHWDLVIGHSGSPPDAIQGVLPPQVNLAVADGRRGQ